MVKWCVADEPAVGKWSICPMGLVPALCYPRNRINAAPGQLQRPIFGGTAWEFEIAAAVAANMALNENQEPVFRG